MDSMDSMDDAPFKHAQSPPSDQRLEERQADARGPQRTDSTSRHRLHYPRRLGPQRFRRAASLSSKVNATSECMGGYGTITRKISYSSIDAPCAFTTRPNASR
jgi:hypothetical protein